MAGENENEFNPGFAAPEWPVAAAMGSDFRFLSSIGIRASDFPESLY
jgi:hypothetical protein